ncbi:uncharacterized protein LOC129321377 isoform X2 [Prosopis cineraria]|uniref:uncharacterized protein LOC129321377 isoform X2 n=1 Tax=Prosopis cineraria TaxID=364024 RepID=UPI002410AD07|nr:uncharacterized protein LOC129321377 isoform X2 [Prosopis cineraria]
MLRSIHTRFSPNLNNHLTGCKISSPISLFHSLTKILAPDSKLEYILNEVEELQSSKPTNGSLWQSASDSDDFSDKDVPEKQNLSAVQISHPWPEWVDLMECLMRRGYFDADGNPFRSGELGSRESNIIRTACLNFGRDRFDLLRYLSRKDIQVIVGDGCPSLDRKVVNSGKRLRAHVGIDEGTVCSACNLRGECERAFVKAREDEGGRTVDLMRIILTYGLDPIIGSVENKPCLNKMIKESVRRLLRELLELSIKEDGSNLSNSTERVNLNPQDKGNIKVPMKQGDWLCPKCNFLNFARNIKCLSCDGFFQERIKQLQNDQEHLPLKKGDWICDKCNFINFARNTRCFLCKEKPPKRQLNPGEWECESCNYLNFRRNMVCLKCDHRRPKASSASDSSHQSQIEDQGYRQSNQLNFGRNQGSINGQTFTITERKNRRQGSGDWRFVEDRNENGQRSYSWNDTSQFNNFPIAGGKTELSKSPQKIEAWKKEMLKMNKSSMEMTTDSEDESWSSDNQTNRETSYFTDDEDMEEWFGAGRKERNRIP